MYGYSGGGNGYSSKYISRTSRTKRNLKDLSNRKVQKMANQFIASCIVALTVIVISNFNAPFINNVLDKVKWAVSEDYNFKENISQISDNFIPGIGQKIKDTYSKAAGIFGKGSPDDTPASNTVAMIMPVEGEIISRFGTVVDQVTSQKSEHYGIDISCEKGMPIMAALDGVVVQVDQDATMGRYVRIRHDGEIETVYGHCSEILVKENQQVKQGDYIAKAGDTGTVNEEQLHFEVLEEGKQINPEDMIRNAAVHM